MRELNIGESRVLVHGNLMTHFEYEKVSGGYDLLFSLVNFLKAEKDGGFMGVTNVVRLLYSLHSSALMERNEMAVPFSDFVLSLDKNGVINYNSYRVEMLEELLACFSEDSEVRRLIEEAKQPKTENRAQRRAGAKKSSGAGKKAETQISQAD